MKTKKLSIIIPTWNTSQITLKCIQTIKKYLSNFDYEIIIVDNGSTDNTVLEINKFKNSLKIENCKLKIILNKSNLGFAKANNIAAKKAIGDYLLFLNSDMELLDSSLIDMYKYISQDNSIGAIGPQFLNTDLTPQASVFPPQNIFNAFKEFFLGISSYSKYTPSLNELSKVSNISGGALMIKKDFFEKIGKWNEKYFFYYEDLDLCRAIHRFNKSIVYYPFCKVVHRHGASGNKITSSENQWRRLIPSSIKYHGIFKHTLINFIIWSGQKFNKIISCLK